MAKYNIDAINGCMKTTQDFKPQYGTVADKFLNVPSDPAAYGTLPSSGAVSGAVDEVNKLMLGQFEKAEQLLEGIARALDAVVQSVQATETQNKNSMTV